MHGQHNIKFNSWVEEKNIILKVLNLPLIVTCGQVMFLSVQWCTNSFPDSDWIVNTIDLFQVTNLIHTFFIL